MEEYASESDAFTRSREVFESVVSDLDDHDMATKTHVELEDHLTVKAREITRSLLQDHLDLRAVREVEHSVVVDIDEVERTRVETGRTRKLQSVHGEVTVERLAYRQRGASDLNVADAVLNLPVEKHSHGLRRLAAIESSRGSFDSASNAIERATGTYVPKRQLEALTTRAAQDIDDFYITRKGVKATKGDVIVLSADGKGIVMRPGALREPTQRAAAKTNNKLQTRLSRGEKRNRKRMAEVGAVYTVTPAVRSPGDIISTGENRAAGPQCRDKWLTASVEQATAEVITSVFDEAERRDQKHRCQWVGLVDGNAHQIERIEAEATGRKIDVVIIMDFVHVLEYLWKAAWSFFPETSRDAERWVGDQATAVLEGRSATVAAAIRRKATGNKLTDEKRKGADTCADYLLVKAPYLDYPTALSSGWPIATGIIEGACRHLVKDRMDITGARWGLQGAEAVLKLRATISNGDFDDYWKFHLEREHDRVHRSRYVNGQLPGELEMAA